MDIMQGFFPKNWLIIGPSVIQFIQDIFEKLTNPPDWGITNLVLIPKVAYPDMITQFRLTSLCITLYKLVSRIIPQVFKPYIANIINPCQAGFVLGCRTSDNIILVQEIIHTLMRKKGRSGYIALKLDLDKAYD